ncbi:30S ribosomal protein S11 [Coxiella endosymbiont of Amblyomma nuttalli]|uniref:30S ribosomal protein S11 n=1 Tax=Coxiella endosymbiont of Amblyomma nuttalli TaxID=2749996 RepID=UPI001BA4F82D|nr:30S ribosomal protein S11 [Coxiella endosymbiont of Amblyomma nuttalli]QTS83814.1 30S ribosomal protein S11 [Coxiella endosymbiont of Amblyomma nuttalli]
MIKKRYRKVTEGIAHIKATFNNTMISVSDLQGNVLCFRSAGSTGFKGSRKGTPYGAQLASEEVGRVARENFDMRRVAVRVRGPGAGRDSAIRGLRSAGLEVINLQDCTRLPHNGCRPRKKRRV